MNEGVVDDIMIKKKLYTKYIGNRKISTAMLDNLCSEIRQKYGNDIECRLLSAELEFLAKEELKNHGYKLVSLDNLTIREFKLFPGIFADNDCLSLNLSEKGVYKCLYDYPIFDHPYAVYIGRKLLCICVEPYTVSGKEFAGFIMNCEKEGNRVEISGRWTHFPGRSFLIAIFSKISRK